MSINWDAMVVGPCTAVFGDAVAYTSVAGGALTSVVGVFDRYYSDPNVIQAEPGVTTFMPVLGVQLSQFPANAQPAQNDTVVIAGMTFIVREVRADGHGAAKLMLANTGS